jgi:hypothetical protein
MRVTRFSSQFGLVLAMLFCGLSAAASTSADTNEPPVKLSHNLICHERGDPYFSTTIHYQSFDTLAECVKAGGRAMRGRPETGRGSESASKESIVNRFPNGLLVFGGLGVAIGLFVLLRFARLRAKRQVGKPIDDQDWPHGHGAAANPAVRGSAMRDLVVACLGDRDAAERLIQYEIDKDHSLSWEAAARAALARIKRDNH